VRVLRPPAQFIPGTMAPIDTKAAELAKLKNKMLEVEAQLREEKKITQKLRDNSEKKIQLIMALDAEIASEVEAFKWKRERNLSDRKFLTDESENKLISLTERELYIQHTVAEFDFLVYENEMLHNILKEVSNEQLKTASVQAKEREKKGQMNFDARIEMEDVHRHTIMSFNNEYQKEAVCVLLALHCIIAFISFALNRSVVNLADIEDGIGSFPSQF
jgi:hypothetical protein